VARAVFGDIPTKRISNYAIAVNTAKAEQVSPEDFASWLENQGGVEKVRMTQSPNHVPRAEKIAKGQSTFEESSELATVQDPRLKAKLDKEKAGASCVLLAEQNDDGSFSVKAMSYKEGLVKTAYAAVYAEEKEKEAKLKKGK
jgi:hypothetical protein